MSNLDGHTAAGVADKFEFLILEHDQRMSS
jgi:hypothetical protein